MGKRRVLLFYFFLIFLIILLGCASNGQNQVYINQNINFGFIKRVAVMPFENLTQDRFAGKRFRDIFVTTLLSSEVIEVPELGDTMRAMSIISPQQLLSQTPSPDSSPLVEIKIDYITSDIAKALGQALGVQGIILGTVSAFNINRSGSDSYAEVSATMRMIDPLTGGIIWSVSHTEKGSLILPSILGFGEKTLHETALKAARNIVNTLLYQEVRPNKTAQ